MSRLGVVLSTATEAPPKEFIQLGQLAEEKGFAAILVNEGRGDALACAEAIALRTSRIKVGTNIANIYFRHPFLAAMTAATISELSDGRLLLGLGVSHRPLIESLGMKMEQPRQYMRSYVQTVKKALGGQPIGSFFRPRPAAHSLPVYVAAVTTESAEIGGELAEGIMPFLPARSYLTRLVEAAKNAAQRVGKDSNSVDCIVSIPTFISDDLEQARSAARYNLAFFAQLPFYRKQWRRCGFVDEVNALQETWKKNDRRAAAALVSDRMVDEVCVFGPPSLCREQLAAFHKAGAAMPVIAVSPVNEERLAATRKALSLLAP
ncbi:MAG TPA: LLM class flavin-dependent oxidoreductase [Candidatus Binatia bacterium]|jgi:alkanesulfonate monooxygenase SsuD/methylene tetrahydromethanopterin reductase-like flavin-dependent oxidoreductase (luciferase family)|nr:LLM class flavin-dependent oxidoreductase [Candidatus Binatia bacterium]